MSLLEDMFTKTKAVPGLILAIAMAGAALSSVLTSMEFLDTKRQSDDLRRIFVNPDKVGLDQVERIDKDLKALKEKISSIKAEAVKVPVNADLTALEARLEGLSKRLELFESAISNSPEKALAVPLLRKDHESLVRQFKDSQVSAKLEYDRVWTLIMLFLSAFGVAVVGLCGWALKSLISKPSGHTSPSLAKVE